MFCYTDRVQEKGPCHAMEGHVGKHRGQSGGRESGREMSKMRPRAFSVFPTGKNGQGKQACLAGLNHLSRLWDIQTVSSCLTPGPGLMRAGG